MKKETLLEESPNNDKNIFEVAAMAFEFLRLSGHLDDQRERIFKKIDHIERQLQDLIETITLEDAMIVENAASIIVRATQTTIGKLLPVLRNPNIGNILLEAANFECDFLISYLNSVNTSAKSFEQVKYDSEHLFWNISKKDDAVLRPILDPTIPHVVLSETENSLIERQFKLHHTAFHNQIHPIYGAKELKNPDHDTSYQTELKIWINTDDAAEANRLMALVSGVLGNIEGLKIKITETGIGSLWQRWRLKFDGWLSKAETQQVIKKAGEAAEAYALDRHIAPVKQIQTDIKNKEQDMERKMTVDQTRQLHDIQLQAEKEKIKTMKLQNALLALDVVQKSSTILASGLETIDSDFKVEIDGVLMFEKKSGALRFNDAESIDSTFDQIQPAEPSEEASGTENTL